MKCSLLLALSLLLLVVGGSAQPNNFNARLTGGNQIPALTTGASGTWEGRLNTNDQTLHWTLKVNDVNQMTMAHIHQGDAKTNGAVVVWLVPRETPQEAQAAGGLPMLKAPVSGTQMFNGVFTTRDIGGPLAGKTLADLVQLMRAGNAYVNVHTVKSPGGEIRGQIAAS